MRRVSGEIGQRQPARRGRPAAFRPRSGGDAGRGAGSTAATSTTAPKGAFAGGAAIDDAVGAAAGSAVAVSIADAIERFDLGEIAVDRLEFLAQPLDVAVDRAVVDVNVLAIGRVHQLVAVLDVPRAVGQRFKYQELGHGQFNVLRAPAAQMARGVENHPAAYDHRLALRIVVLAREFAAADQRADALDQKSLRE